MFTDSERTELISRLMMVLDQQKAGRADARKDLAELLADVTREYLKGRYNAGNDEEQNQTGVHRSQDFIDKSDFGR